MSLSPLDPRSRALLLVVIAATFAGPVRAGESGAWVDLPNLPTARQETGAALLAGKVYVVGGLVANPLRATNLVEAYDVAQNRWDPVPPVPAALDHMGVTALRGKLYVIGGFSGDFRARSEVWVFDPAMNMWCPGPPLPSARGACWAVAHLGKIYVFGGDNNVGAVTRSTFIFDGDSNQWSQGANMPTAREHLNAVVAGPFIYVIGGRNGGGSTGANERYDPAANTWRTMSPMPTARSALFMERLGSRIYATGGEIPQLFATHEVYDIASNTWTCAPDMAIPRHGIAVVPLADRILAPAGGTVQGLAPTNRMDAYVPEVLTFVVKASPDPPQIGQPFSLSLDVKNPGAGLTATLELIYLVNGNVRRRSSITGINVPAAGCLTDVPLVSLQQFPSVARGVLVTLLRDESDGSLVTLHSLELEPGS